MLHSLRGSSHAEIKYKLIFTAHVLLTFTIFTSPIVHLASQGELLQISTDRDDWFFWVWNTPQNASNFFYNQRQNELRLFTLNWAFLHFTGFKRRKYNFSSPIPSMQCCADVRAPYRKQQTSQLWMEGTGEGCGFSCSLTLPYLSTMSRQFWRWL